MAYTVSEFIRRLALASLLRDSSITHESIYSLVHLKNAFQSARPHKQPWSLRVFEQCQHFGHQWDLHIGHHEIEFLSVRIRQVNVPKRDLLH
jgi:hypothetical protein